MDGVTSYTPNMPIPRDFADFCCELLSGLGPVQAKRMFGGWGLSVEGLTVALLVDLGGGDTLWLKADADSRIRFEAEGCQRFTYDSRKNGQVVQRSVNYYSAPDAAMDSSDAMLPWARLALQSALSARSAAPARRPAERNKARQKPAAGKASAGKRPQG